MAQWDWGKIIKDALPFVALAGGGSNMYNGYNQGQAQIDAQQRQKNMDDWNKLLQDEELKRAKMQNDILAGSQMQITPEIANQFKGTQFEPFLWGKETTPTNITGATEMKDVTLPGSISKNDYLSMLDKLNSDKEKAKLEAANNITMTPEIADQFKGTPYERFFWTPGQEVTKYETISDMPTGNTYKEQGPGNLISQNLSKKDYFDMMGEGVKYKSGQALQGQKNAAYESFINLIPDNDPRKGILITAYQTGDNGVIDDAMKSFIPKTETADPLLDLKKRKLEADIWSTYNPTSKETKPGQPTQDQINFKNSLSAVADQYKRPEDYLQDLKNNRSRIIERLGSDAAYNKLVQDAENNVGQVWGTEQVMDPRTKLIVSQNKPGVKFKPGQGSPMGILFGGGPRSLISNKPGNKTISYQGINLPGNITQPQIDALLKEAKTKKITFVSLVKQKYPLLNS
jgi:hypothetical protein